MLQNTLIKTVEIEYTDGEYNFPDYPVTDIDFEVALLSTCLNLCAKVIYGGGGAGRQVVEDKLR